MTSYKEIAELIKQEFQAFVRSIFPETEQPRKYFYWSLEFFKHEGNLSFQYFTLSEQQKTRINERCEKNFLEKSSFKVSTDTYRFDLQVENIKTFVSDKKHKSRNFEYIKEFIFLHALRQFEDNYSDDEVMTNISDLCRKQRDNFLITYMTYLVKNENPESVAISSQKYTKYTATGQGQELLEKLDQLDKEYVYNENDKLVKTNKLDQNPRLRIKIENLYVLNNIADKLQFVFSINGASEKEELRELLEIMGKDESGELYRGQADASWSLSSSLMRESNYLLNESKMYYEILSLKPGAFQNDKTVYERLITMQHYGMPTRLLDITRNPLVAIFFACSNLNKKAVDGVIYTFNPKLGFLNFEDIRLENLTNLFNSVDTKGFEKIIDPKVFEDMGGFFCRLIDKDNKFRMEDLMKCLIKNYGVPYLQKKN